MEDCFCVELNITDWLEGGRWQTHQRCLDRGTSQAGVEVRCKMSGVAVKCSEPMQILVPGLPRNLAAFKTASFRMRSDVLTG